MSLDPIYDCLQPIVGEVNSLDEAEGGLFNRVFKGANAAGGFYCKQFSAQARSGMFPPLPTSPGQRHLVAWHCHEHAYRCSQMHAGMAQVPGILGRSDERHIIVMEAIPGQPLYGRLHGPETDKGEDEREELLRAFCRIAAWLALFHGQPAPCLEAVREASDAFKRFKVTLQYGNLMGFVPGQARGAAMAFVDDYLGRNLTLVHGDLNSRNILMDGEIAGIIDFEQGHAGEGVYDLAYIASELVLKWLALERDPEEVASRMWCAYREAGLRFALSVSHCAPAAEQEARFRKHLVFQAAYRMLGPSREIWSGDMSGAARQRSLGWARETLLHLFL